LATEVWERRGTMVTPEWPPLRVSNVEIDVDVDINIDVDADVGVGWSREIGFVLSVSWYNEA
jgi:hypothetical protein